MRPFLPILIFMATCLLYSLGFGQSRLSAYKYLLNPPTADTVLVAKAVTSSSRNLDPEEPFLVVDLAILDSTQHQELPDPAFLVEENLEFTDPEMRLVLKTALSYMGTPYEYGGTDGEGIDCSGLVYLSYKSANRKVPRTSRLLSKEGKTIKWTKLETGDLIFFSPNLNKSINHVGLVIRSYDDDVLFVHSHGGEGVVTDRLRDPYWWKRFRKAKRL